jgi:hypothetical protein
MFDMYAAGGYFVKQRKAISRQHLSNEHQLTSG